MSTEPTAAERAHAKCCGCADATPPISECKREQSGGRCLEPSYHGRPAIVDGNCQKLRDELEAALAEREREVMKESERLIEALEEQCRLYNALIRKVCTAHGPENTCDWCRNTGLAKELIDAMERGE